MCRSLLAPVTPTTTAHNIDPAMPSTSAALSTPASQDSSVPAVLMLLQLLTSDVTQAHKPARISALQLLDCLLSSAGTVHIGDTCRRPPAQTAAAAKRTARGAAAATAAAAADAPAAAESAAGAAPAAHPQQMAVAEIRATAADAAAATPMDASPAAATSPVVPSGVPPTTLAALVS